MAHLTEQLKEHRRTFEAQDESDGVGYVAQRGVKRKAEEVISLRDKAPTELKAQLDKPPIGVLNKQEIGEWLWRSENPGKDPSSRPQNLTARADTLVKQWQEQGLEIYLTSDGKIAFDKSLRDAYETQRSSKKPKTSESEYVSPYKDSMYGDSERITIADGWEFQTGEIISATDRIAEEKLDAAIEKRKNQTNDPNQIVEVDPTVFGDAAAALDDLTTEKKYKVGETVAVQNNSQNIGYRHFPAKDSFGNPVGRIGGLDSGGGFTYPQLATRLKGVDVGDRLDRLRRGEKLPDDEYSPIIGELYGLWFAKEGSHPWKKNKKTGEYEASNEHKRDLIYSEMIVDLMKSENITFEEAIKLHPAAFNGAQAGARRVTIEIDKPSRSPMKSDRKQRDERYRREKETIQTWFDKYAKQLEQSEKQPTTENLEQFIKNNL